MYTANLYIQDSFPIPSDDWMRITLFEEKKENESNANIPEEKNKISFVFVGLPDLASTTSLDPIEDHLIAKVYSVILPEKWRSEGISPPTIKCKEISSELVLTFYHDYTIIPERISATIEGGIFVKYIDYVSGNCLSIEVYNDLDIVAIITNNKQIVKIIDIDDENIKKTISIFQKR